MCFFFFELRNPNIILANVQLKDTPHVFRKYLFFFQRRFTERKMTVNSCGRFLQGRYCPFLHIYFINKTCILQILIKNKNMSEKFE